MLSIYDFGITKFNRNVAVLNEQQTTMNITSSTPDISRPLNNEQNVIFVGSRNLAESVDAT